MPRERRILAQMTGAERRALALDLIRSLLWRPYIWGGDDPIRGYDCSGLIVEVLQGCGVLPYPGDWSAHGLWMRLQSRRVDGPAAGRLVFFTSDLDSGHADHVEICISDEISVGASGGGRQTRTAEDAAAQNAYVRPRPIARGRKILGYVDPFLGL